MSVDSLQEKIRKTKNPSVLELAMAVSDLPPQFAQNAEGYAAFCRELLEHLNGFLPAVRVSFSAFVLLGHDGLYHLSETLKKAGELGYYVLLDAPEIFSPASAILKNKTRVHKYTGFFMEQTHSISSTT